MARRRYDENAAETKVAEAEQSLRDLDALAAEKADVRDKSGMLVCCYPSISAPSIPADWNRKEARGMLRSLLPLNEWHAVADAANLCAIKPADMLTCLERLAWFGFRWKAGDDTFTIDTAVQHDGKVDLGYLIHTPEGALVLGFIKVRTANE